MPELSRLTRRTKLTRWLITFGASFLALGMYIRLTAPDDPLDRLSELDIHNDTHVVLQDNRHAPHYFHRSIDVNGDLTSVNAAITKAIGGSRNWRRTDYPSDSGTSTTFVGMFANGSYEEIRIYQENLDFCSIREERPATGPEWRWSSIVETVSGWLNFSRKIS